MSDKMRMIPFGGLIDRMMDEWRHSRSVFDIKEGDFYRKSDDRIYEVFGQKIERIDQWVNTIMHDDFDPTFRHPVNTQMFSHSKLCLKQC